MNGVCGLAKVRWQVNRKANEAAAFDRSTRDVRLQSDPRVTAAKGNPGFGANLPCGHKSSPTACHRSWRKESSDHVVRREESIDSNWSRIVSVHQRADLHGPARRALSLQRQRQKSLRKKKAMKPETLILIALLLASAPGWAASKCRSCTRDRHGRISRSTTARHAFQRSHPCPSTGKVSGPCPGYVIDHIKPLKRGGPDSSSNMQWQIKAAARAKDRTE